MSWPLIAIGEFCRTGSGGTPSRDFQEYYQGNIPWIKSGDLKEKTVEKATEFITELAVRKSSAKIVPKGAILLAMYGATVGRMAMLGIEAATNQAVCSIIPDETQALPKYVYYALLAKVPVFLKNAVGGAQPNISQGMVRATEIHLPPLSEQQRIVAILDKADAIRRKRQQANQLADDFLRAVFLDMFGDPVSNTKGWEVKLLKNLSLKIHSGTTPKGGRENYVKSGVTFLRSQNVWKRKLVLDDVAYIDEATHKKMIGSSLNNQDILMTKTGRFNTENSSLGRAAMFLGESNSANVNGHVYLIRLDETIDKKYVLFILTMPEYYEYIRSVCVGGIDKRQLNKEHLENFPIICPSIELQQKFSKFMSLVDEVKIKTADAQQKAEHMFDALSQKTFSSRL